MTSGKHFFLKAACAEICKMYNCEIQWLNSAMVCQKYRRVCTVNFYIFDKNT